jgi:endogenous inhibitor of DNA gyrase (YacG/DUF329 family)
MTVRMVNCPQCGKPAPWNPSNLFRPFCSERGRLIDLGAWASESYRIPVSDPTEETEEETPQPPLN